MKREILINGNPRETRVAIIEDDQLVELMVDRPDARRSVGDIYVGKVEAVLPGIQAAFVEIGTEKSAFLHASDLVYPEEEPEEPEEGRPEEDETTAENGGRRGRTKGPPIQDVVKKGQEIVVQVSKEPISTKGPRVTAQVSLAGRFLVYMPFASRVGVSRKIGDRAERQRLREQVQKVLPDDSGGVIVRTVGEDVTEDMKGIAPELMDRVKLHEEPVPVFDKFDVETEIRDLFKRRCDLPSGGYLIIEPTEALVSVDVNSGRYTGKKDPEKTSLRTNLEAAREGARQLRLRDVGGIIVCDFIDMDAQTNRDKVLQELRTHLGRDRARTKAFAVSDLGLIEMTRQRVRQSHLQSMTEPCPTCNGTGRVFTPETIVRRVERSVKRMAVEGKRDDLVVKLHPDTAMYVLEQEQDLM